MMSTTNPPRFSGLRAAAKDPRLGPSPRLRSGMGRVAATALAAALCAGFAGCTASSDLPQLSAITVVDPNGNPIPSVALNLPYATVSVSLGQNSENLAVNWSLSCLGSPIPVPNPVPSGYSNPDPNPCGQLSKSYGTPVTYTPPPLQPVGSAVTIEAISASDPSITASVTCRSCRLQSRLASPPRRPRLRGRHRLPFWE